jgi:adenylate cyclase
MSEERARRKLSGILSADAVAYSRLMQEDEASTILTLADSKELMANLIQQYRGRVVDAPGDNLLAEFGSVVDAAECALKIQQALKTKNAQLPENRKMPFRIGVNLGDVVEEAGRIYGDGVNIAARLEGLADPGGICISRTAYDHVKNKLDLGYEYLGEQSVKNIAEPVRVYRVLMEPEAAGKVIGEKRFLGRVSRRAAIAAFIILLIVAGAVIVWNIYLQKAKKIEPASVDRMAFPLPGKPSIAVLPFENMSSEPEQEYLSDAISEEIITALAKTPKLFVIARNSTFTYKGKPVKVQKVAEDLGVRYVLEGSVQRSGDRLRITAQLIDALDGKHLWAEKYDRGMKDIFELQDEITKKIITALQVKLTSGEKANIYAKETNNLEAYLKYLQASEYRKRVTKEDTARARKLSEEAIALDPKFAAAYVTLGWTYLWEARFGWSKSRSESMERALELAHKANALDENHKDGSYLLSYIYRQKGQYEKAIAEAEKLIDLEPNNASAYAFLGGMLYPLGRGEEAIAAVNKGIRLNPMPESYYYYWLGMGHWVMGQYEEAVAAYKKAINLTPTAEYLHIVLTVTYSLMDRDKEARAEAAEVLKVNPEFSVERIAKTLPFKDQSYTERYVSALRKAGLK